MKPAPTHLRTATAALGLAILLACTAGGRARAASFDCAKAAPGMERTVCADAKLSALDGRLAGLYAAALARLSPQGATSLRSAQRGWLAYARAICQRPSQPEAERRTCLLNLYTERANELARVGARTGPFVFTRVDLYRVEKAAPALASGQPDPQGPGWSHIAYPQIDAPRSAAAQAWNQLSRQTDAPGDCGDPADKSLDYRLGLVTRALISVTWTHWEYCHGTAHGHGYSLAQTIVLDPTPRPLRPADLFRTDRPWEARLHALLLAKVEQAVREDDGDLTILDRDAVKTAAAAPGHWSLRAEGLAVAFDPYELGEGYSFAPEILIPWSDLKPVLARDPTRP
jgi:uncharacterized protein